MGLLNTSAHNYYEGNDYGSYQFTSLDNVINQFMIAYVGESKIISKVKRQEVAFHAQRAMQELSFDTFKSHKGKEYTVPATLTIPLPQDYVNYTKISSVDSSGVKHLMYPTNKTSNPIDYYQNSDGDFKITATATLDATLGYIVLDGEYLDVIKGMIVVGQNIPSNTKISRIDYSSENASVYLVDLAGNEVLPTYTGTETVTIIKSNGTLVQDSDSKVLITGATWNITDYKITTSDASDIKVGMTVSNEDFPIETKVVSVNDNIITVNLLPAEEETSGDDVTFISPEGLSKTWESYKSIKPSENNSDDYEDDIYWPLDGERYGLDPQHAQVNGSFYIDQTAGKIHFSSNVSGNTVIVDYISDSLGTDGEMQVHKFAEEAMYKWIAYAVLSTRINTPEYLVARFKKERFAENRKAKLRLSNIKIEEITQVLRGKSKQIKH